MFSHDNQTIVAQCTPQGLGAIAIIRLSGTDSFSVIDKMSKLPQKKVIQSLPTHTVHFGWVIDAKTEIIDHVLYFLMRAPHTFTSQDTIEISCHNNQLIIGKIIETAIKSGARLAENGEFSKRAVLNNKMDIIQAEAINELIASKTEQATKQSLAQLNGTLSQRVKQIEKRLIKAVTFAEASFEFIDEELELDVDIIAIVTGVQNDISAIKVMYNQQQQIREGVRIAIIGATNVGKSSLFNALIGKEQAIVTDIAGTTRDTIEAGLYHNGMHWTLIDTAGLRHATNIIEKKGIDRSFEQANKADIILLVYDGSRKFLDKEQDLYRTLEINYKNKIVVVYTKSDLLSEKTSSTHKSALSVSSKTNQNIDKLHALLSQQINAVMRNTATPFLLNQRQYNLICSVNNKLTTIQQMLLGTLEYELISYHLHEAISCLTELSGKSISELAMDTLFREFCVGK